MRTASDSQNTLIGQDAGSKIVSFGQDHRYQGILLGPQFIRTPCRSDNQWRHRIDASRRFEGAYGRAMFTSTYLSGLNNNIIIL